MKKSCAVGSIDYKTCVHGKAAGPGKTRDATIPPTFPDYHVGDPLSLDLYLPISSIVRRLILCSNLFSTLIVHLRARCPNPPIHNLPLSVQRDASR
jgi:hypothetical protein